MFAITFPSPQFSTGFHPFSRFNCLVPSRVTSPNPVTFPYDEQDSTSRKRAPSFYVSCVQVHFRAGPRASRRGKTFHVLGRADASIQCHDQTAFYETWCNKISIRDGRNRTTIASIDDSSSLTRETISHLSSLVTNVHSNFLAKQIPVNKADLVRGAVPLILKTQFIPR